MSRYCAPFVATVFCKALVVVLALLVPCLSFAASLFLTPRTGSYAVGDTFSVGIVVEANDTAFNAVSGTLTFPAGSVDVVSLSKASSVISLWVQEPSFSNSGGTISFEGIILNPGYKGSNARILTVQFRAKKEGTVPLGFSSSEVLANDGVGTNILTSTGKGSYTLTTKTVLPPTPIETAGEADIPTAADGTDRVPSAPRVVSDTHKADAWSNQTSGTFSFGFGEDVTAMRLLVDDNPDSVPTVVHQPPITERSIDGLAEGSSYLHVQLKNQDGWGAITHYHLQIDTKEPESLEVTSADNKTFNFISTDTLSGIDHFEVSLDGGETQSILATNNTATYVASTLVGGRHLLAVKAFDKAGNMLQSSKEFITVEQPTATGVGSILPVPQNILDFGKVTIIILSIVIPLLALLGLLAWLLFFIWKLLGGLKRRLRKETQEAKSAVRKSFGLLLGDLDADVKTLQKAGKKRALTREEIKVLKRLQQHIALTEAFIYKEISDIEDEVESIPGLDKKTLSQ